MAENDSDAHSAPNVANRAKRWVISGGIIVLLVITLAAAIVQVILPVVRARRFVSFVHGGGFQFIIPPHEHTQGAVLKRFSTIDRACRGVRLLNKLGLVEEEQRWAVAYLLGACGPGGEALLAELAQDKDPKVRLVAGTSLNQIGSPQGAVILRKLSRDPESIVRESAIWRLAFVKNALQADIFCRCLASSDRVTRDAATDAMKPILGDELRYLLRAYRILPGQRKDSERFFSVPDIEIRKRLEDPRALGFVTYMLRDGSITPHWRSLAAFRLTWAPRQEVETLLLAVIREEKDPGVQAQIAFALAQLGIREGEPALIELLQATSSELRIAASEALSFVGGRRAHAALSGLLQDSDPKVQQAAKSSMVEIEKRLGPPKLRPDQIKRFKGSVRKAAG